MSIRITNKNSGRTFIIKNQDDLNHLDTSVTSIDDDHYDFDLFGDEGEDDSMAPFSAPNGSSNLANRRAYKNNNSFDDDYDFNNFDDGPEKHYIAATAYPLADEIASWSDPTTVNAPDIRLKDVTIPDDQTQDDFTVDDGEAIDGLDFSNDQTDDNFSLEDGDVPMDGEEEGDQDFQGMIRTVRGACLVYKRKTSNGTYDELWIYNVGQNLKKETAVRKAILAGTDIDPNTQMSDDGEQKAKTTTIGNVQYLNITGMVQ